MRSPNLTVTLGSLQLTAVNAAVPARLQVTSTLQDAGGEGAVVLQLPQSQEGCWRGPCSLSFDTTLGDLLRAPEKEAVQFFVVDESGVCQGEAALHFRVAFSVRSG